MRTYLVVLLLWPLSVSAQTGTAERILSQCASAMNSHNAARSLTAHGQVSSAAEPNENGRLTIKTSAANQFHQEEIFSSGLQVTNIDGRQGYWSRNGRKRNVDANTTSYFEPDHIPALACLPDGESRGFEVHYVGMESLDGRSVYHLRFAAKPKGKNSRLDLANALLSERHVFIDVESNVVTAIRYWVFAPNALENRSTWEVLYSDYRPVDGVLMPCHIEDRVNGKKFREVIFTEFRTDLTITDEDFK